MLKAWANSPNACLWWMAYRDLRDFIHQLEQVGELKRVSAAVSPHLEMTALRAGGPALLFEHPTGHNMPVLGNLFGSTHRVALGMGVGDVSELRSPPCHYPSSLWWSIRMSTRVTGKT